MNKKLLFFSLIIGLLVVSGFSCARQTQTVAPINNQANQNTNGGQASSNVVNILNFSFTPGELTINNGGTAIWQQNDAVPHQIISNSGLFESNVLNKGDQYSFKFDQAGEYGYYCKIHPSMRGKIIVK
jgi:plastocyanin